MSKQTQLNNEARANKVLAVANLIKPDRITKPEKDILKTVFGIEVEPYIALRDLFFGFELDENQKQTLTNIQVAKDILKKQFLPEVKKDIAVGVTYDLWQSQDMASVTAENFETYHDAKLLIIDWLVLALKRLENFEEAKVDLTVKRDRAFLLARNWYISYINQQIQWLMQFSNMDELTPEEQRQLIQMNSAK